MSVWLHWITPNNLIEIKGAKQPPFFHARIFKIN